MWNFSPCLQPYEKLCGIVDGFFTRNRLVFDHFHSFVFLNFNFVRVEDAKELRLLSCSKL